MKAQGFDTWIVEKPYNVYTRRREDLFNFADLVGIREDAPGVTAVQACSEDVAKHVEKLLHGFVDAKGNKIAPNPHLPVWLKAGNRFFIWSWCLRGKAGKRKLYRLRQIEFRLKNGVVTPYENEVVTED